MSVVEKEKRKKKGKERKKRERDGFQTQAGAEPSLSHSGAKLKGHGSLALGSVSWRCELVTDCLPLIESSAESDDARLARRAWKAGRLLVSEFLCTSLPRESSGCACHFRTVSILPCLAWINDSCGGQQKSFSPSLVMCTCFLIGTMNPNFRHLSCFPHFVMPPLFSSPVMLNPGQRYQTAHLQPSCTQFTRMLAFSDESTKTSASRCP